MSGIDILDEDRSKQVNLLGNFENSLNCLLSEDKCSDEMRDNITKKMQGLTELLVSIMRVMRAKHFSVDTKREAVENSLDSFDFKAFGNELKAEIESTRKILLDKTKGVAMSVKKETENTAKNLISVIDDNIKILEESLKETKDKKAKLERGEEVAVDSLFDVDEGFEEAQAPNDGSVERSKDSKAKSEKTEETNEAKNELDKAEETKSPDDLGRAEDTKAPNDGFNKVDEKGQTDKKPSKKLSRKREIRRLENLVDKLDEQYDDKEEEIELAITEYKEEGFFGILKRLWSERKEENGKKQGVFSVVKNAFSEAYGKRKSIDKLYGELYELTDKITKIEKQIKNLKSQRKGVSRTFAEIGSKTFETIKSTADRATASIKPNELTHGKAMNVVEKVAGLGKRAVAWGENMSQDIDAIFTVDGDKKDKAQTDSKKRGSIDR